MFWLLESNKRNYSSSKVLVFIHCVLRKLLPSTVTLYCVKVSVRRQIKSLSPARILTSLHHFPAPMTCLSLGLWYHMWSFLQHGGEKSPLLSQKHGEHQLHQKVPVIKRCRQWHSHACGSSKCFSLLQPFKGLFSSVWYSLSLELCIG